MFIMSNWCIQIWFTCGLIFAVHFCYHWHAFLLYNTLLSYIYLYPPTISPSNTGCMKKKAPPPPKLKGHRRATSDPPIVSPSAPAPPTRITSIRDKNTPDSPGKDLWDTLECNTRYILNILCTAVICRQWVQKILKNCQDVILVSWNYQEIRIQPCIVHHLISFLFGERLMKVEYFEKKPKKGCA